MKVERPGTLAVKSATHNLYDHFARTSACVTERLVGVISFHTCLNSYIFLNNLMFTEVNASDKSFV